MTGAHLPARDERQAIADVVLRLQKRFPDVAAEHVAATVARVHHDLGPSRIRQYIPVLVEHDALLELRRHDAAVRAARPA